MRSYMGRLGVESVTIFREVSNETEAARGRVGGGVPVGSVGTSTGGGSVRVGCALASPRTEGRCALTLLGSVRASSGSPVVPRLNHADRYELLSGLVL